MLRDQKISSELLSVLKTLRRFIPAREKMQLVEDIPDISALSGGSASWFFAPLDEGFVRQGDMRKFISAIESIYSGIDCGHFSLSADMHEYVALVYLLCERSGGSATSMAGHAVNNLLVALDHSSADKSLIKTLLLHMDRDIPANADSEVSTWHRLMRSL